MLDIHFVPPACMEVDGRYISLIPYLLTVCYFFIYYYCRHLYVLDDSFAWSALSFNLYVAPGN